MTGRPNRLPDRFLLLVTLAALAAGCGGGSEGQGIVSTPIVTSVTIVRPNQDPIDITGTVLLSVDVKTENNADRSVTWSSSAPSIASVSTTGLVKGEATGQATITATSVANSAKTDQTIIVVNPARVVGVTLEFETKTIAVNGTFDVKATVQKLGPIDATVEFSTNNTAVATVSSTDGLTATIVGVGAGQAIITAKSKADATKTKQLAVTVTGKIQIPSVNPSTVNILRNATVKLVPVIQADNGVDRSVTYQSQNNAIATVAADGTVTGIALGQTSIIVRANADNTVSVTVPVTVRSGVNSVSLTPDVSSVRRGETSQLAVNVDREAGISNAVNLSSANPAIATIDAALRVTANAVGQTYVRALSTVDPSVGDSTLVVVVDPCVFHTELTLGANTPGTVSSTSCNGVKELFAYRLLAQTTLSLSATTQFPGSFEFFGAKNSSLSLAVSSGSPVTDWIVAAPGHYRASVTAQSANQRGNFSITTATNPSLLNTCHIYATTGVTIQNVPMNQCGFRPSGQAAGTWFSMAFGVPPDFQAGDVITLTITTPTPIVPYIEVRFGGGAVISRTGTNQSLAATFTVPAGGGSMSFVMTSVTAGQIGNVTVKIEGPPAISFDAFVFGYGMRTKDQPPELAGPRAGRMALTLQRPVRP